MAGEPSWTYQRRGDDGQGHLFLNGKEVGTGYSGKPPNGLNNPEMEQVPNVGPIPGGKWLVCSFRDDEHLGPCVAPLLALKDTNSFGRSGFFIHGDNPQGNHSASDGCIILARDLREMIKASGFHPVLLVE